MTSELRLNDRKEPDTQGPGEESPKQRDNKSLRLRVGQAQCEQRTERRPVQRKEKGREKEESEKERQGEGLGPHRASGFHFCSSASPVLHPKKSNSSGHVTPK